MAFNVTLDSLEKDECSTLRREWKNACWVNEGGHAYLCVLVRRQAHHDLETLQLIVPLNLLL